MKFLHSLARSPYLSLASGAILVVSTIGELLIETEAPVLRMHHGLLFLGVTQIIQSIPHFVHGARDLDRALSEKEKASPAARPPPTT